MPKITREEVRVPADVMPEARDEYITNYLKATRETGRLMLFACDQKIEHLNKDFYGEGIDIADAEPQHLFEIGRQGVCGVLAGPARAHRAIRRRLSRDQLPREDELQDQHRGRQPGRPLFAAALRSGRPCWPCARRA